MPEQIRLNIPELEFREQEERIFRADLQKYINDIHAAIEHLESGTSYDSLNVSVTNIFSFPPFGMTTFA